MKRIILSFTSLVVCGSVLMVSCADGTGDKIEDQADSLGTRIETGMENMGNRVDSMTDGMGNKDADRDFLSDAVEANTKELQALMLGQQKGSKEVKTHAGHMIADHKKLGDQVSSYIAKKNIVLENVDTTGTTDLNDKPQGKEFDKEWANKMVKDHEKVIDMFEDAQDDVKDPELKTMITNALPKLKSHLEMAKQLDDKLNK